MTTNRLKHVSGVCLALFVVLAASGVLPAGPQSPGPYSVSGTMHIGGAGRRFYLTVDSTGRLIFVTRTTHTMVIDAANGSTVADIGGGSGEHGVTIVPSAGRGFISDGETGNVIIFDLKTYAVLGSLKTAPGAEGIIYDPASDRVFVSCVDSSRVYPIAPDVDPKNGSADPAIEMPGKLEYLAADGRGNLYVAVRQKGLIAVVDTKSMKIVSQWPVAPGSSPAAISMNVEKGYLFIGCHNKKMIVMNANDGTVLADLPIGAGVDATAWTGAHALASSNDGTLTVVDETSPGKFAVTQTLKTATGARTMAVNPVSGAVYLPYIENISTPATKPTESAPRTVAIVVITPQNPPAAQP